MTRCFIGPLTPAQHARRLRARERYREIAEIMDARYCTFREALRVVKRERESALTLPWGWRCA